VTRSSIDVRRGPDPDRGRARGAVFARVIGQPRIKKPLANANLRAYFFLYEL